MTMTIGEGLGECPVPNMPTCQRPGRVTQEVLDRSSSTMCVCLCEWYCVGVGR